jgi:hypothetical protein
MPQPTEAILQGPAGEPPPGPVDHSNLSAALYAMCSTCIVVATAATAIRMYAKIRIMKDAGLEDWLAAFGWALHTSFCATAIIGTVYGSGYHVWDLRLIDMQPILYVSCLPIRMFVNLTQHSGFISIQCFMQL